jgi:hypothetical protein
VKTLEKSRVFFFYASRRLDISAVFCFNAGELSGHCLPWAGREPFFNPSTRPCFYARACFKKKEEP